MFSKRQFRLFSSIAFIMMLLVNNHAYGQGNEKTLTLNSRNLKNALEKKGRFPLDISVSVRGNRSSFDLTYLPTEDELVWDLKFDITDEEFIETFDANNHKNLKLIRHHEYLVKGKSLHVALWHFDRNHEAPKDRGTIKTNPKTPKKEPLKQVWSVADKIPSTGELVRGFAKLDNTLMDFMKANQVPGLSVAVFHHGQPVYARAFGYSDIPTMTTLKPDQPMRVHHSSQIITSAAVMKLVQDGKVKLDDTVFDLLEFDGPPNLDPAYKTITIRHLMQHSGGFDAGLSFNPFWKMRTMAKGLKVESPLNRAQVIEYMLKHPLDYEPGTKQVSSSFGYMLLGRVIEKASGMTYEEYVQKNILKKLKTKSVSLGKSRKEDRVKKEPSYYSRSGTFVTQIASEKDLYKWVHQPDGGVNMDLVEAGGGWITTPTDLLTIVNAIRTTKNSPILDRKHIEMFFAPPVGIEKSGTGGNEASIFGNNGCYQEVFDKDRVNSFRFGSGSGSSAFFLYRFDGFSWAVIANCEVTKDKKDICKKLTTPFFESLIEVKQGLGIR